MKLTQNQLSLYGIRAIPFLETCFLKLLLLCSKWYNLTLFLFWSIDFRRRENFSFMASTSSSNPSTPVTLSFTLSLPKSCTSHTANKIENLVEYSYIPESAQINESSYPLLSPYQLYKHPSSFTRSIRTLISTRQPHPKNISSLPVWINVLFKQPLLSNMLLLKYPQS